MTRVGVCGGGSLGRGFALSLRRAGFDLSAYNVAAAARPWCDEQRVPAAGH